MEPLADTSKIAFSIIKNNDFLCDINLRICLFLMTLYASGSGPIKHVHLNNCINFQRFKSFFGLLTFAFRAQANTEHVFG